MILYQRGACERKDKTTVFKDRLEMNIRFQKASLDYYKQILQWLDEPHVKEFWDNSIEHRQDIRIFMEGRKDYSPYWDGMFDYWMGFVDGELFCLLMTSLISSTQTDLPESWKAQLSKQGKTFSIDFMIGNKKYLGQGLGGVTLDRFCRFLHEGDQSIDTFIIDPAVNNPKAKRVYEKAGFNVIETFTRDSPNTKNVEHFLMVKSVC